MEKNEEASNFILAALKKNIEIAEMTYKAIEQKLSEIMILK